MKFKSIITLATICLFWISCSDVALLSFDIELESAEFLIMENPDPNATWEMVTAPISPKEDLDANGIASDKIKEVSVKEVNIILISPETGNFNWANSAEVLIMADGLDTLTIGEIMDVEMNVNEINVKVKSNDISEYMKAPFFSLKLKAVNDEPIPVDHQVLVQLKTKVKI
jgi:hypothetical protein